VGFLLERACVDELRYSSWYLEQAANTLVEKRSASGLEFG
jgi:hypothetical protein